MVKIGIADTTFSRVDMFRFAEEQLKDSGFKDETERYTVPGVKDLPVACKILFEKFNCDLVLALGMPGKEKIDKVCSHEASTSIQELQLQTGKHILEVFVHMGEAKNDKELFQISENRTKKHVINALELLKSKTALSLFAGKGRRQGFSDEGSVEVESAQKNKIKLGFVVSEYHKGITEKMEEFALKEAEKSNAEAIKTIHVLGVFDAPLAVKSLLERKEIDAVVVLGAVIHGKTAHDEVVAFTCAQKVSELSLRFDKPVGFGVIGPKISIKDAEERAEPYARRAVETCIKLINSLEE
ncbi:riboflavin synthase [Candidatus Micrarchaeota archaeon]|nr:riboflavin synthase [Candidatus Micrarchaeota archaeon]MBU2476660.1 riboflavin synthase [Candidatus Micrarchaeota archaeon]